MKNQPNQPSDPNWFGELLSVIQDEELIRLRWRLQKAGNSRLAEVLTDELEDREPNLWTTKAQPR
jgi:hypothetical protein